MRVLNPYPTPAGKGVSELIKRIGEIEAGIVLA